MTIAQEMQHLFAPEAIAVIGASDNPDRIGGRPLRILADRGYQGDVYPVNPKYATVQGLPCYKDIADLPVNIDLYVICLAARAAVDSLKAAVDRGARSAVIFSGGFAEVGHEGRKLQEQLAQVIREAGVAVVGPNSLGIASFWKRSFPTFATTLATLPEIRPGHIALLSQSGGTAFNLFTESYWAGARFSHVIATGNEVGVTFSDYLSYLSRDDDTHAVIGYLEGIRDGEGLRQSFEALRAAGKPVFVLKTGRSQRGRAAVMSHTAQLSGDDSAFNALFSRCGVTRLSCMDEAIDVARAISLSSAVGGLAVATNSGGGASYLSDACEQYSVPLAEITAGTRAALAEALPSFAGLNNPIDFTAQVINDLSLLDRTLDILDTDPGVDAILVFLGSMEYLSDKLIAVLAKASERLRCAMMVSWLGVGEKVRMAAANEGLKVCGDPVRLLRGLGLVRRAKLWLEGPDGDGAGPTVRGAEALPAVPSDGRDALGEWAVMGLLEERGIRTPKRRLVSSPVEAVQALEEVGAPCVLKVIAPFIAHRARVGGVELGVSAATEMEQAFERMARDHGMTVGVVEEQVAAGPELIVGLLQDETFGTRAVIGRGGVSANELNDVRVLVPPYDSAYIGRELGRLWHGDWVREFAGPLGAVASEVSVLLDALASVREAMGDIEEIECNPAILLPWGLEVADALAFRSAAEAP